MDNRVIAILEHFGFLTREEAEHIADGIKTGVGSESYKGAYEIVKDIIAVGEFKKRALLPDLEARIKDIEAKITTIKVPDVSSLEARIKVLEAKLVDQTKKPIAQPQKAM